MASDAQYARPDGDITTTNWSTTPLYSKISEATYSDVDYITAASGSTATAEVSLSNISDPLASTGHIVRWRMKANRTNKACQLTVYLLQGTSTIASQVYTQSIGTSFNTYTITLTSGEADSITDYTDLRFRFYQSACTQNYFQVSWAEFETPDVNVPPTINIDQPDGVEDYTDEGYYYYIQYDLADSDNTVTADFYYDTNSSGLDGTAISDCQDQTEGTDVTCLWNLVGVTPGAYYIYGITSDGVNPQVSAYSSGVLTIDALPTLNIDQPDGVNDTIAEDTSYTIQYDLEDPDDVVTASFSYCTDPEESCISISDCTFQPEGIDTTCIWDTTGVSPGDYYVVGECLFEMVGYLREVSSGPVTINGVPEVINVSLNSGADIDLTADTTEDIDFTATVSDDNGYGDITNVTGRMYRSGVSGAEDCTADNNNCYYDSSCTLSDCADNSCTATCTVPVAFFADATDTGTYSSEYWMAWIEATDSQSEVAEGFSPTDTTEMNSLLTISAPSAIAYGNILPNGVSSEKTTVVTNAGNRLLDLRISGNDMCTDYPTCSGDKITVGNQEFAASGFTYGNGRDLSVSTYDLDINIVKSTVIPSNSTGTVYWIIGIPALTPFGDYTGINTIISIVSP